VEQPPSFENDRYPESSMNLSNPQDHGMNALEIFFFLMLSRSGKLILLFSLRLTMVICLYAKYMSMT
jgi:hypothetical protein